MSEPLIKLTILHLSAAAESALAARPLPDDFGKPQFRRMQRALDKSGYDAASRTVTLSVSSEFPVERWDGTEVLVHDKSAIDTSRLDRGISHLYNHNWDILLGRTRSYDIKNKELWVTSEFASNQDATEREKDVAGGSLPDVSLGYQILKVEVTEDKVGTRTYNVVRWMPLEWSSVTVPADYTVGLNRAATGVREVEVTFRKLEADEIRSSDPDDEEDDDDPDDEDDDEERRKRSAEVTLPTPESTSTQPTEQRTQAPMATAAVVNEPQVNNAERVTGLRNLRSQYPQHFSETQLVDAVSGTTTVAAARNAISDAIITAAETSNVRSASETVISSFSQKESELYSRSAALRASINQFRPGTFGDRSAGLAKEVSDSIKKEASERGVSGLGDGVFTPGVLNKRFAELEMQKRTIASGGNAGAATNFTTVEATPIEMLRSMTWVMKFGARMLPGLHGTPQFPRQNAAASSSWLSEGQSVTNSDPSLDSFIMQPHRLSIQNSYYRDFLALSALSIDGFLSEDRMAVLARSLDYAVPFGSGVAPVPLGFLNRTGISTRLSGSTRDRTTGVYAAGAGGVAPTNVDLNGMEGDLNNLNALIGNPMWATTPKVRTAMRNIPKFPGSAGDAVLMPEGRVDDNGIQAGPLGYNLIASTNMPTNFTVGSATGLHPLIFGIGSQVLIGDWDLNEIITDNITEAAAAKYKITEHSYLDTNVRHLECFDVMFVKPE